MGSPPKPAAPAAPPAPEVVVSGKLFKKGGGAGLFSRRNWKLRHFELVDSARDETGAPLGPALATQSCSTSLQHVFADSLRV